VIRRVCVVGAGSIGSLFAAHLAQVAEVSVLTRRPAHAGALERDGLRVSGRSDLVGRVRASTNAADLGEQDLVILACKGVDLEGVAAGLEGAFAGATFVTVQNGLGAEEIVRRRGGWPLISGVTFMSGTKHSDTHVEYILDTPTWLGPYDAPLETVCEAAALIASSGLRAEAFDDLRPAQWAKLIFNATVNAVAALTRLPHDFHYAENGLGELVHALVDEGKAVAAAAGVELREDPWQMNVHATKRGAAHYPSMLEDVEAQRPTEIELITGALVREAQRHAVPVPLHTALCALVRGKEASYT
jgi:2-dehydropantoate 2-reductase